MCYEQLQPVELIVPRGVFDVKDALADGAQALQAALEVVLSLQQGPTEPRLLGASVGRQIPLLTVLPTSKLILVVTDLRENKNSSTS